MATPQTGTNDLSSDSTYDQISKGLEVLGSILIGGGMPSVVRIPIAGTGGLAVELIARGFVPKAGSTSTLFFQTLDGKRNLRLDYGFNKKTNTVDFHWNQKGTCDVFGITDHSLSGKWGEGLYKGARAFRYTGRVLVVLGAVVDVASIVTAHDKWRQASSVAGGWAGAWGGAEAGGAAGAWGEPLWVRSSPGSELRWVRPWGHSSVGLAVESADTALALQWRLTYMTRLRTP